MLVFRRSSSSLFISTVLSPLANVAAAIRRSPLVHTVRSSSTTNSALWPETISLLSGLKAGHRASLSKAITLIESTRSDHRRQAELLLDALLASRHGNKGASSYDPHHPHPMTKATQAASTTSSTSSSPSTTSTPSGLLPTFRVGVAGPPGAGKSTLIEAVGLMLVKEGYRVAVLAVDPSSSRTGGSILGDKTRMADLSRHPQAFVRPSPTKGTLGGLAAATSDVILLCEGAGYDMVLVETVGLGQSEVAIDSAVDMVWLVLPPGGGDELQGVKKGIVEVADMIVVNKADGDLIGAASRAAAEYGRALQLLRPKQGYGVWLPTVVRASAVTGGGLGELLQASQEFREAMGKAGKLLARRKEQAVSRMWVDFEAALVTSGKRNRRVVEAAAAVAPALAEGAKTPRAAAADLVTMLLGEEEVDGEKENGRR